MWRSLGRVLVPAAGVPVRATINEVDPTLRWPAHSILFQQVPGNTGRIYIGQVGMNVVTGAGVLAVLAIPTANILPSSSATITMAVSGFNLADFWIDVSVGGEACQVSGVRT